MDAQASVDGLGLPGFKAHTGLKVQGKPNSVGGCIKCGEVTITAVLDDLGVRACSEGGLKELVMTKKQITIRGSAQFGFELGGTDDVGEEEDGKVRRGGLDCLRGHAKERLSG